MKKVIYYLLAILTIKVCYATDDNHEMQEYKTAKSHLAIPVENIAIMKDFYTSVFNVEAHEGKTPNGKTIYAIELGPIILAFNEVEKVPMSLANTIPADCEKELRQVKQNYFIPCQHFGLFHLTHNQFTTIVDRLVQKQARFLLEPTAVNPGTDHEQMLTFIYDPQGYIMELRASHVVRGFQAKEFEQQAIENQKERAVLKQ